MCVTSVRPNDKERFFTLPRPKLIAHNLIAHHVQLGIYGQLKTAEYHEQDYRPTKQNTKDSTNGTTIMSLLSIQ